jgi:hypothetical protein
MIEKLAEILQIAKKPVLKDHIIRTCGLRSETFPSYVNDVVESGQADLERLSSPFQKPCEPSHPVKDSLRINLRLSDENNPISLSRRVCVEWFRHIVLKPVARLLLGKVRNPD